MLITGKAVKERLKTGRPLPSFFACLGRSDLRVRLRRQREFERTKERSKRREKIKVPGSEWSIIPLYELYRGDDHSFFLSRLFLLRLPSHFQRNSGSWKSGNSALSPIRISLNQNFRLSPSREINSLGEKRKWEKWRMKTWLEGKNINLVHF